MPESLNSVTPTDEQAKAINAIVEWYGQRNRNEFYLAGYAGVGKSTIARIALEEIRQRYGIGAVKVATYTGKAAAVLRRKGNSEAQTIHSLIYVPVEDELTGKVRFALSEDSPISSADLVLLDECSMIDDAIAADLRSFGKKILVMGDPGQLPPVNGQGAFTRSAPDLFLHEIHRQAADSPILELATMARKGERLPIGYSRDGVEVLALTKSSQELVYRESTQPICGLNRVRWVYTQRIRRLRGFSGERPQAGERLMCCRNNRAEGIFNGGMGTLLGIGNTTVRGMPVYSLTADMEDVSKRCVELPTDPVQFANHFLQGEAKPLPRIKPMLNEFDWGYVVTAHKAQGSQFPHVTVVDDSQVFRENASRWLYTSLTRAESGLTVLMRA
jgi:exodeoxyribonuclease-5